MNEDGTKPEISRPWWANGRASVELFQRHRQNWGMAEDRSVFVDSLETGSPDIPWLSMTIDQERARLENMRSDKKRSDRERRMSAAARFADRFGPPAKLTGEGSIRGFRAPHDRGR